VNSQFTEVVKTTNDNEMLWSFFIKIVEWVLDFRTFIKNFTLGFCMRRNNYRGVNARTVKHETCHTLISSLASWWNAAHLKWGVPKCRMSVQGPGMPLRQWQRIPKTGVSSAMKQMTTESANILQNELRSLCSLFGWWYHETLDITATIKWKDTTPFQAKSKGISFQGRTHHVVEITADPLSIL
jgi:hypothetical protein